MMNRMFTLTLLFGALEEGSVEEMSSELVDGFNRVAKELNDERAAKGQPKAAKFGIGRVFVTDNAKEHGAKEALGWLVARHQACYGSEPALLNDINAAMADLGTFPKVSTFRAEEDKEPFEGMFVVVTKDFNLENMGTTTLVCWLDLEELNSFLKGHFKTLDEMLELANADDTPESA